MTLPAPRTLEKDPLAGSAYRSIATIGRGSMGLVVEAEHVALGKRVVVKLLHAQLADSAMFVDRMRLEAEALGRLDHPNLVAVNDVGDTPEGRPFFVMERLRGRSLHNELKERGAIPVPEAIDLVRQLLAGLGAAHRAGIVHRDVKPDNLFLCDAAGGGRRTLKILDFGIAKVIPSAVAGLSPRPLAVETRQGTTVGTPRFLAPEQALGRSIDPRTDLYAAGAVLYLLLAGVDPFHHHREMVDLLRAHATEIPRPLSDLAVQWIPAELDHIARKALAKRPEDRFQSAAEFDAALASAASGSETRTEPLPGPPCGGIEAPLVQSPDVDADADTMRAPPPIPALARRFPLPAALFILLMSVMVSVGLTALMVHQLVGSR